MTDDIPESVERAFEYHDAYEREGDAFLVQTAAFEGRVTAVDGPDYFSAYTVTVRVPTLDAASAEDVGAAVEDGWFETLERRLEDASKATRADVELTTYDVERDGEDVYVTYGFEWGNADRAAEIAKTFVEYVEGTYVEGVVPGYEYEGDVADLLGSASQRGEGNRGGTPL
jgi:hypothetical protein